MITLALLLLYGGSTLKLFVMMLLVNFFRSLFGPSLTKLAEDFHVRLLTDWVMKSDTSFIHPRCFWKLNSGHPCEGIYEGQYFYDQYKREVDSLYSDWHEIVNDVIGSPIGGIVIGQYQFRHNSNGLWYTAPFTHFYRIHHGKIIGVRFYMGDISIHLDRTRKLTDLSTLYSFHTLN